mgnify:CR=1 FL=1
MFHTSDFTPRGIVLFFPPGIRHIRTKHMMNKIQEDISPTRNLSGIHLKIVFGIAVLWTLFQLWYASPFPFIFNFVGKK